MVYGSNAGTYWFINDHLGAPRAMINESGQTVWKVAYLPFGKVEVLVDTIENNFRLPGQYFDAETGFHYNMNRYYDPDTGRYITADPIGLSGGVNLYLYVLNDPVNWVDPDGLKTSEAAKADAIEPAMGPVEVVLIIVAPVKVGVNLLKQGGKVICQNTFKTAIDEGGSKLVNVQTKNGKNLEVMFDEVIDGDVLTLRKTHIEGAKPGDIGVAELKNIAREYGRERGFKQIVIEGGKRSTGRMKGKTPRPMVINVD